MSNTNQKPKAVSRWGSLLQGAVAGLESRLDTILAEDATLAARSARSSDASASATKKELESSQGDQDDPNNKVSSLLRNKTERPLQRFTKSINEPIPHPATANQDPDHEDHQTHIESPFETSAASSDILARSSPNVAGLSDRNEEKVDHVDDHGPSDVSIAQKSERATQDEDEQIDGSFTSGSVPQDSATFDDVKPDESLDLSAVQHEERDEDQNSFSSITIKTEVQPKASHDIENEEVHSLLERIDALQAKIRYLAKDAEDSAKRAAAQSPKGSLEKQLAEKSSQVALLMQEGEKLSRAEVNHTALIKRLRRKIGDDEKSLTETRRMLNRTEISLSRCQADLLRLHSAQKEDNERLTSIPGLERDLEKLRDERASREAAITGLRQKVESLQTQVGNESALAESRAVSAEKKLVSDLRKELDSLRNENLAAEEKGKQEKASLEAELELERERLRSRENSLRSELSLLESKFEFYRSRSEEASFTIAEDAQANLVRQIETLQHQYAVASENWQGIESSLLSRIAEIEREKNEAQRQEAETRKKFRETNSKARSLQETLDESLRHSGLLEDELKKQNNLVLEHRAQAQNAEQDVKSLSDRIARDRLEWDETLSARIEEERQKFRAEIESQAISRTTSPIGARKLTNLEISGGPGRKILARNISTEPFVIADLLDRSNSRRSSNITPQTQDLVLANGMADRAAARHQETRSRTPSMPGNAPETPSIQAVELDDTLDRRSSPHRTVNDVLSGSPVHAGPSVQLVERMSAAVRRLENEKAATKDEIERLVAQRDDARQEVVTLMREVENTRSDEAKSLQIESELEELRHRHQTTLELLGEKSEQVEELRADVADLKKIYRDLVERSVT